jgi:CubicO group peptidase (beta-lactamase class C family)
MPPRYLLFPALLFVALMAGCANLPGWMIVQGGSRITDHQKFDNAPIARAAEPSALPTGSAATLRLPDGPEGEPFEQMLERNGTVAFVVVQGGRVVYERYLNGFQRDSVGTSFSVAKSVVSAMVGVAIHEGKIEGVDTPITRYLPELERNDPRFAHITLRHLLEMRSGIAFDESYSKPWSDAAAFYLTPNLAGQVAGLGIEGPPDVAYQYRSGNTQLLGMAVERATGIPLAQYVQTRLWQPMGAAYDASWSLDSHANGTAKSFCCLNARALDFARFGMVFLHGGRYNGRQIIPADWVVRSTEVRLRPGKDEATRWNVEWPGSPHSAYYAWQWRQKPEGALEAELGIRPSGDFYAQGRHGQYIYVAPKQDMVIVRLGSSPGMVRWPALLARLARMNPAQAR